MERDKFRQINSKNSQNKKRLILINKLIWTLWNEGEQTSNADKKLISIKRLINLLREQLELINDIDKRIRFIDESIISLNGEIEKIDDVDKRMRLFNELIIFLSDGVERTNDVGERVWFVNIIKDQYQKESRRRKNIKEKKKMTEMAGHVLRQEIMGQEDMILKNNLRKEKILRKFRGKKGESERSMNKEIKELNKKIKGMEKIKTDLVNNLISIYKEYDEYDKEKRAEKKGWGFHEVEIIDVRFFNSANKEINIFRTGEKFIAKIKYLAHKKIKTPLFGIAIHTDSGIRITGPNTTFSKQTIEEIEGKGEIHFITESLPLLAGTYLFSVGVYDFLATYPYDQHYESYKFRVINKDVKDRYGIIHMPCKWKYIKP